MALAERADLQCDDLPWSIDDGLKITIIQLGHGGDRYPNATTIIKSRPHKHSVVRRGGEGIPDRSPNGREKQALQTGNRSAGAEFSHLRTLSSRPSPGLSTRQDPRTGIERTKRFTVVLGKNPTGYENIGLIGEAWGILFLMVKIS